MKTKSKTMNSKIYQILCVLFCIHVLSILIDEFSLVGFYDDKDNTNLHHSICLSIDELIEQKILAKNKIYKPNELISSVKDGLIKNFTIQANSSYIYHHHVCLEFRSDNFSVLLPILSKFKFKIFAKLVNDEPFVYFFETDYKHDPYLNRSFTLIITFVRIKLQPPPLVTNCTLMKPEIDKIKNYNKLTCLLNCYKSFANHTLYYYNYDENVSLNLTNRLKFKSNRACENRCEDKDCLIKYSYSYLKFTKQSNQSTIQTIAYRVDSLPLLCRFEFKIQLISIVVLFLNLSLYDILNYLTTKLKSKIQSINRHLKAAIQFRKILSRFASKLYLINILICFFVFYKLSYHSIQDYLSYSFVTEGQSKPTREFHPFTLIICMPVQQAYKDINQTCSIEHELIFQNKSIHQIINDTNDLLNRSIKKVYLAKGALKYSFKLELANTDYSLFRKESFVKETVIELLSRCFAFDIKIEEDKYMKDYAFTQILIKLHHSNFRTYLLNYKRSFTYEDAYLTLFSKVFSKKYVRLAAPFESACLDYSKVYKECDTKNSCIDLCYNKLFFQNYSSISTSSVFNSKDQTNLSSVYFNDYEDKSIREHCKKNFSHIDCVAKVYVEELEQEEIFEDMKNRINIELYIFEEQFSEFIEIQFTMLFFKILNYLSLTLGLNAKNLIDLTMSILRQKVNLKFIKLFYLISITICLISFLVHSFIIIDEIVNDELENSQHFEKLKEFKMPSILICFELDELDSQIDIYEEMTGYYLDKLSSHLTIQTVFDRVTIFNESTFDQVNVSFANANLFKDKIYIDYFYLFNIKCFNIHSNLSVKEKDLLFFEEFYFMKIYFKPDIYLNDCNCTKMFISFYDNSRGDLEKLSYFYFKRTNKTKSTLRIQPGLMEKETCKY